MTFYDKLFGVAISAEELSKYEEQLAKKDQKYWDPAGEINFREINARSAKALAQYHFLKANPKHFSKNRLIWFVIGLSSSLLFWFLDFNVWIPAACFGFTATYLIFQRNYLFLLSKDLLKIQLAEKNNWLYDPKPSPNRYKILKSHFSKIFNKGDNNSQNISDEFWGLTTLKQKEYFFNAGLFYYSIKVGDNTKSYLRQYLFIKLEKEIKKLEKKREKIVNGGKSTEDIDKEIKALTTEIAAFEGVAAGKTVKDAIKDAESNPGKEIKDGLDPSDLGREDDDNKPEGKNGSKRPGKK